MTDATMWGELGYLWTSYQMAKAAKDVLKERGIKAKVGRVGDEEAWYVENPEGQMLLQTALGNDEMPRPLADAEMVFMMGQPAAGKSTVANQMFGKTHVFIDCDAIAATHPDYDPKNPEMNSILYRWSSKESERVFDAAIEVGTGHWVVDGTGANAERMVKGMQRATAAGFTVKLLYVTCSLEESIRRNRTRSRTIREGVITEKAALIATSFELVSPYASEVIVVDNTAFDASRA